MGLGFDWAGAAAPAETSRRYRPAVVNRKRAGASLPPPASRSRPGRDLATNPLDGPPDADRLRRHGEEAARIPRDNQEPLEQEPVKPEATKPKRARERTPFRPIGRRGLVWLAVLGVVALILILVASRFDEYICGAISKPR